MLEWKNAGASLSRRHSFENGIHHEKLRGSPTSRSKSDHYFVSPRVVHFLFYSNNTANKFSAPAAIVDPRPKDEYNGRGGKLLKLVLCWVRSREACKHLRQHVTR